MLRYLSIVGPAIDPEFMEQRLVPTLDDPGARQAGKTWGVQVYEQGLEQGRERCAGSVLTARTLEEAMRAAGTL